MLDWLGNDGLSNSAAPAALTLEVNVQLLHPDLLSSRADMSLREVACPVPAIMGSLDEFIRMASI